MELVDIFKALSNDVRIDIVRFLAANGRATSGQVTEFCDMSQPAVSNHLSVLRKYGIVNCVVDKSSRYYSLVSDNVYELIRTLEDEMCAADAYDIKVIEKK